MERYTSFTRVTDQGPYITGLILHLDREIRAAELPQNAFNVYAERRDPGTGELLPLPGSVWETLPPSRGYRRVLDAWPCSPEGIRQSAGRDVWLALAEEPLGKKTQGSVLESRYIRCPHRVTQLLPIPAGESGDQPLVGLFLTSATEISARRPEAGPWRWQSPPPRVCRRRWAMRITARRAR